MNAPQAVDLRVGVPATWLEIDLDPGTRAASFERLVAARGQAAMAAGMSRAQLVGTLETIASRAEAAGATYAALYSDVIQGVAVSASLVASVVDGNGPPPPPGADATTVAQALQQLLSEQGPAELHALPAGPAVRVTRRLDAPTPGGGTTPVENIRYFVPLPGLERLVLLEFSTPTLDLAETFGKLFDAIAATLSWT